MRIASHNVNGIRAALCMTTELAQLARMHNDAQVVQVDQMLKFRHPIMAGDRVYCEVSVESVRRAHGTDIIMTKQTFTNEAGDVVQETYTTLAGRAGEGEEGFSNGAA